MASKNIEEIGGSIKSYCLKESDKIKNQLYKKTKAYSDLMKADLK